MPPKASSLHGGDGRERMTRSEVDRAIAPSTKDDLLPESLRRRFRTLVRRRENASDDAVAQALAAAETAVAETSEGDAAAWRLLSATMTMDAVDDDRILFLLEERARRRRRELAFSRENRVRAWVRNAQLSDPHGELERLCECVRADKPSREQGETFEALVAMGLERADVELLGILFDGPASKPVRLATRTQKSKRPFVLLDSQPDFDQCVVYKLGSDFGADLMWCEEAYGQLHVHLIQVKCSDAISYENDGVLSMRSIRAKLLRNRDVLRSTRPAMAGDDVHWHFYLFATDGVLGVTASDKRGLVSGDREATQALFLASVDGSVKPAWRADSPAAEIVAKYRQAEAVLEAQTRLVDGKGATRSERVQSAVARAQLECQTARDLMAAETERFHREYSIAIRVWTQEEKRRVIAPVLADIPVQEEELSRHLTFVRDADSNRHGLDIPGEGPVRTPPRRGRPRKVNE